MRCLHALLPALPLLALAACASGGVPAGEPGDPRVGRVVLDTNGGQKEVLYLAGRMDDELLSRLAESSPNLTVLDGLDANSALEHAAAAHGADVGLVSPEFLEAAENLAWIQIGSAGVERYLERPEIAGAHATVHLTNAAGVHGPVIAEHVFAMLLAHTRSLRASGRAQARGEWDRSVGSGSTSLAGSTLLVVGMGGIGSEVARRAKAFDMVVHATVRTPRPTPDYVDHLATGDQLDALLPLADHVVICLPLTAETEGLFDAQRLARMKQGATLVNIARGRIVNTDALIAALNTGHLAFAGLDVSDPEPLIEGHPLWGRDDVLITPHVAGRAELTGERRNELFLENLQRFAAGRPLLNVVDRTAGY